MSFLRLLIHDVTVRTPSGAATGEDRYGNPTFADAVSTEKVLVQPGPPSGNDELTINRDTRITRFRIFARPATVITSTSVLTWGTRTLKVDGEPRPHYNPRKNVLHHWEIDAEEILG